jgi:hypothetical protein
LGEEDPPPFPAREAIVLRADPPSLHPSQPPPVKRSDVILNETYWDSSEAKNISEPTDGEINALEAVNNQLKLLHEGLETPLSCFFLIAGCKEGDNQKLTKYQVWILQPKCMLISLALSKAVEMMPRVKNWDVCCKLAIVDAARFGVKVATTSRMIQNWYCDFREKRKFPMYLPEKPLLPQSLDENKDICVSIQQYAPENLNRLSIEFMSEYLHDVILPKMIKEEYRLEPSNESYEEKVIELLKKINLDCISPVTIARWLEKLGVKYQQRKKGTM